MTYLEKPFEPSYLLNYLMLLKARSFGSIMFFLFIAFSSDKLRPCSNTQTLPTVSNPTMKRLDCIRKIYQSHAIQK